MREGLMRSGLWRAVMLAGLIGAMPLLLLWATGSLGHLALWAAAGQREAQNALARAIRALRAGEAGALTALLGLAFAYGVFHAAGPGHGKVLIGGYGVARRVRLLPLMALALVSSLAQATLAVLLVYAGVAVLNWTRERVVGAAEDVMLPASHVAVGLIGLWLAYRGWRGLVRQIGAGWEPEAGHGHGHGSNDHAGQHGHHHAEAHLDHNDQHDRADDHGHPDAQGIARGHVHDETCGHSHGPTLDQIDAVTSPRQALALIAGIAARPCTGALFLLVLTWQMGIGVAGVAGAYAMGLGTAVITVMVAALSVWAREGMLATLSGGRIARALPILEMAAGLAIAAISAMLLQGVL